MMSSYFITSKKYFAVKNAKLQMLYKQRKSKEGEPEAEAPSKDKKNKSVFGKQAAEIDEVDNDPEFEPAEEEDNDDLLKLEDSEEEGEDGNSKPKDEEDQKKLRNLSNCVRSLRFL